MTPWYRSPTIWIGITSVLIAALDGLTQSGLVTSEWWQQVILAAIGCLTIWRRVIGPPATAEELDARETEGQTPTSAAPATTTPEVPRG